MADSSFAIEGRRAGESQKSRSYKKYVIIAVVCGGILALAIILTGILVGLRASGQKDIMHDIQVMKIQTELYTKCFVTALNRTMAKEPSNMKLPSADELSNGTYMQNMTYMTYRSSETPIFDIKFMGQTARNTCEGMSTYWLFPNCEGSDNVARRPKRWFFAALNVVSFVFTLAGFGVSVYGVVK